LADRRARVWRSPNERLDPTCVAEHAVLTGFSHGVAGISAQGKTDLYIIENGTLTAVRYVNEILNVHVRTSAGAVGPDFILVDDNARAHIAFITNRYLEDATIVRMYLPARSPDLNPIEQAWDMLQKGISSHHVQSTTVQELRHAIIEECAKIPHHKVSRLISSMRRRC
jgi:hypothetical protein